MKIGLNAHLLSSRKGYRTAGIHGYIYNTLLELPRIADANWQFTAMIGGANSVSFDKVTMKRAAFDTDNPSRRIFWEQLIQPFVLQGYDLYHAMAFVAPVLPIKQPFVVTIYDLSFMHYPQVLSSARRAYLRALTEHTCKRATRVIGISRSTADDVIEAFGIAEKKVDVAFAGTNFEVYKPLLAEDVRAFRHEKNLPEDFWLFLGTLEPRKNLPTLLRAYARLPQDSRPMLVIGGAKGWDYAEIFETIDRYRLADSVRLPGFIPADELPLWYNSAKVFVYPSVYEGFGIPPLEAMACGIPVIVSDVSSLPEVIENSDGLRVPPHDVDAWEAALRIALDDSAWLNRASKTGLVAAQRFSWKNSARQTLTSYRNALGM